MEPRDGSTRVNICGTGAMACLFGSRLSHVANVTLVGSWPEGIAAIREHGIRVEGDPAAHFDVAVAGPGDSCEPAELVLVLVKTWQTAEAAARLERLLSPGGVVLILQNGIGNRAVLGSAACVGITFSGATLTGPGRIRPGGDGPTYAAVPGWVVDLLRRAGFDARRCDENEIDGFAWGKLVANCAINPVTALLGVRNGEALSRPDAAWLIERAATECAAVARARGISLPFDDAIQHARDTATRTAGNCSSMLQDLRRGAPTEVDSINGAVVREGARLGIATPVNEALWRLVRAAAGRTKGADSHACK
jgi:2-dehydropantoate 2-reductase